jgi:pimeloyl-ACP methyl ester carboxylesterase
MLLLVREQAGVPHAALSDANHLGDGLAAAAKVRAPAIVVIGERDVMTPAKAGRQLAAALAGAKAVVLPGAGHILMQERPDEVLAALAGLTQ